MREVNTKEINWYPLQKVNFARRKLEGANPSAITRCSDFKTLQIFLLEFKLMFQWERGLGLE